MEGGEAMNTDQFVSKLVDGKWLVEAWVAVWRNEEKHVAIAAPSLPSLEMRWKQITGLDLISSQAQHVHFSEIVSND